jgi:hypothetical protein
MNAAARKTASNLAFIPSAVLMLLSITLQVSIRSALPDRSNSACGLRFSGDLLHRFASAESQSALQLPSSRQPGTNRQTETCARNLAMGGVV